MVKITLNKIYPISSDFGSIDSAHPDPHSGIDLVMESGTPILSPVKGIVSRIVDYGSENLGKGVMVKIDGNKELIFGHLSRVDVREGDTIFVGQQLALSGNSGNSTGDHLHLGLKDIETGKFLDPSQFESALQKIASGDTASMLDKIPIIKEGRELSMFLKDSHNEGLWYALTGKHFGQWFKDGATEMLGDIGGFIVTYADFLVIPASILGFLALCGMKEAKKYVFVCIIAYLLIQAMGSGVI